MLVVIRVAINMGKITKQSRSKRGILKQKVATKMTNIDTTSHQEIWVLSFHGQGHLLPCIELCKHISSRNLNVALVIPPKIASTIPSSLTVHHPLLKVLELPCSPAPPPQVELGDNSLQPQHQHSDNQHSPLWDGIENLLASSKPPVCVVVDVLIGWTIELFKKFEVPTVAFFTSGACSSSIGHAMWKSQVDTLNPGETRSLPGLPHEMALTDSDFKRKPPPTSRRKAGGLMGGPPGGFREPSRYGPFRPGGRPPWLIETDDSIALIFNTCDELELPFIEYLSREFHKPIWGVGPLLPEKYWKSIGSVVHDREVRANRESNVTENDVIGWLNSKPPKSVLYVSFGSEVGPKREELMGLADALEASDGPFIWVIQPHSGTSGPPPHMNIFGFQHESEHEEGYFPHGLDQKVGSRGLIISGWAPQLLILSHPSTRGFLSHCGWNSVIEGIGRGVPFLAWPIRGDQFHNMNLVVKYLKVGYKISNDFSQIIKKDEILSGIECLMRDDDMKIRATALRTKFNDGFPKSSTASIDAFVALVAKQTS